ncbi:MAG: hypothetical protein IKJ48_00880, partial [Alistipes sp.]|nr:hypothetical protein [Alistipes sp.]
MKRFLIIYALIAVAFTSCIENDIPLPVIVPKITSMEVDGTTSVVINSDKRTVNITLNEQTDIKRTNIRSVTFDNKQTTMSWDITGEHDLSSALSVTLSIYQDYNWTITANQPIERYFTVEGQVGASEIDVTNHRVVTYVNGSQSQSNIKVTSLKLGPKDISTYSPDIAQLKDFTNGQQVDVTFHGRSEKWNIFIEQTETLVEMKSVDAWTGVAWVKATGIAGQNNGF